MSDPISEVLTDAEWHVWRAGGLGASDVPALLGLSSFQSPWSLWASKVGLLPPTESTDRQDLGHDLEPILAKRFTRARPGLAVAGEQTWCQHPEHGWARATVDGLVVPDRPGATLDDLLGVAEWKSDGGPASTWRGGIPERIQAQCQWQMLVTETPRAWIGVFHSGFRFEVYELERDDEDIAFILERAKRFWEGHVVTGEPPPIDGSDATAAAIAAIYPEHQAGKAVELDPSDLQLRDIAKELVKMHKEHLAEVENRIRERLGDAEIGAVDGVPVLSYRAQQRSGIDLEALRRDHPTIAQTYSKSTTHRVLRAAPKSKQKAEAA